MKITDRDRLVAASLRQAAKALSDAAAALDGNLPGQDRDRKVADLLRALDVDPAEGLTRADASRLCKESGIPPRAFGSLVARGLVIREGDRRWTSAAGRAWYREQEKLASE